MENSKVRVIFNRLLANNVFLGVKELENESTIVLHLSRAYIVQLLLLYPAV